MRLQRFGSCLILFAGAAALAGLSGCALYSEARDKQGQEAKAAWGKVDLAGQLDAPKKNIRALLAQQLQLEDDLRRAQRNNLARSIATGGTVSAKLMCPISEKLKALAGSAEAAKAWGSLNAQESASKQLLAAAAGELRWVGFELPSCEDLKKPDAAKNLTDWAATASPAQAGILYASIANAKNVCTRLDTIAAAKADLTRTSNLPPVQAAKAECDDLTLRAIAHPVLGGTLAQTLQERDLAVADLDKQRTSGLARRNAYRLALADYNAAAAELKPPEVGQRARVLAAAHKLRTASAALARLPDAFSAQFISEQKRASIDALLATLLDTPPGTPLPQDASKAVVALVVFPDIFDNAQAALANAKAPNLVPFLMQKNLEEIRADAATKDVAAQIAKLALLDEKLQAQSRQAAKYLQARAALEGSPYRTVRAAEALAPVNQPTEQKMALWRATAYYLDAVGRLTSEEGKVSYQLRALERERALAYSESNVMQWGTLINSNVDQMAEFGASGVKKEHLIALLNSASLLAIGIGTNK